MKVKQLQQLNNVLTQISTRHPEEIEAFRTVFSNLKQIKSIFEQFSQSDKVLKDIPGIGKPRKTPKYPKTFSIESNDSFDFLQETIDKNDLPPLYCSSDIYEAISNVISDMQEKGQEFDRFVLVEKSKKICPPTSLPAVIVCIRFWMSIDSPIIEKNKDNNMFHVTCKEDFGEVADEAWNSIVDKSLRIESPRNFKKV